MPFLGYKLFIKKTFTSNIKRENVFSYFFNNLTNDKVKLSLKTLIILNRLGKFYDKVHFNISSIEKFTLVKCDHIVQSS